jgi:hypothetical protein
MYDNGGGIMAISDKQKYAKVMASFLLADKTDEQIEQWLASKTQSEINTAFAQLLRDNQQILRWILKRLNSSE